MIPPKFLMKYDLLLKLASLPLEEHLENSMTFGAIWVEKTLLKTGYVLIVSDNHF
jgi:hypothetical protein